MTFYKASLALGAAVMLGACSITVDDDGYAHHHSHDDNWRGGSFTANLDNGDVVSFGCPEDMKAFVVSENDGEKLIYGCRTSTVPVPGVGDGN